MNSVVEKYNDWNEKFTRGVKTSDLSRQKKESVNLRVILFKISFKLFSFFSFLSALVQAFQLLGSLQTVLCTRFAFCTPTRMIFWKTNPILALSLKTSKDYHVSINWTLFSLF